MYTIWKNESKRFNKNSCKKRYVELSPSTTFMRLWKCQLRFTLIELLVVVSIIGILASLLLPALSRARYQAQLIVCVNLIHEQYLGIINYTSDYNDLFPDPGLAGQRKQTVSIGSPSYYFDLRPSYKEYFGVDDLNTIMKCPLSQPWWWNEPIKSDLNGPSVSDRSLNSTYSYYYGTPHNYKQGTGANEQGVYWAMTEAMLKSGSSFKPYKTVFRDREFDIVLSDMTAHYAAGAGGRGLLTNHRPFAGDGVPEGSFANMSVGYKFYFDQSTTGSYCGGDGHIETYRDISRAAYLNFKFIGFRNDINDSMYIIPADMEL